MCPLEGDRTAHYERSQATIKNNKEYIGRLRLENKKLHKKLAETKAGDERIIRAAFHNRGVEKDAYRNMSGKAALTMLEKRVLGKTKRLNAQKHTNQTFQRRLDELKMEYEKLKPEGSSRTRSTDARALEKEEDAMKIRALENSLKKTQFKYKEAENIMIYYLKLKNHLQDESLTFQGQLDRIEAEILKQREELHNLHLVKNEAQLSKEAAKAELQRQEELLYKERKERERIIESYRKKAGERKAQAEKVDRRAQRTTMQPDELNSETQRSTTRMAGEEEKAISTFEEAFRRIKEATGVTDMQEIVECFISQKETHQNLVKLKRENEEVLVQLKGKKELLDQQFEEIKYSGEAKLSSEQRMLEECEHKLKAQQQRCGTAKERLDWLVKTLSTVRAGVEHLVEKLEHIALSEDTVTKVHLDSDEFVMALMHQCELKLQLLNKEFEGMDLAAIVKEMEEDEFYVRIEGKPIEYNQVKLSEDQKLDLFNDEDESEEDEVDIISREALKRQSQLLIDSNSKKKPWKKKNSKF
ncbi:coiled-coil domain-containing protein 151 isoform X2 [Melanotaenia boesemani]|uniref:coiled-coil domain-containing protein 151 isoform X2 n=1 Tax=Melanotaenia boesemani TaxID=1250792 RepID=UPI001C03D263|nr:coiled-coil domain-containing protein 151 isoform X2 [Melanotaenia boesemani]